MCPASFTSFDTVFATLRSTQDTPRPALLLIACGNNLRRDDGAGLVLAEIIAQECRAKGVEVQCIAVPQLLPELTLEIARPEVAAVLFVDTVVVVVPGTCELGLELYPLDPDLSSPSLGHHVHPATLMTYAGLLYGRQPPAWVMTIPGVDFDHGEGLSETTRKILCTAPELLAKLI